MTIGINDLQKLDDEVKLHEFDKEEWKDIALLARPDLTDEEYDEMWDGFIAFKQSKRVM